MNVPQGSTCLHSLLTLKLLSPMFSMLSWARVSTLTPSAPLCPQSSIDFPRASGMWHNHLPSQRRASSSLSYPTATDSIFQIRHSSLLTTQASKSDASLGAHWSRPALASAWPSNQPPKLLSLSLLKTTYLTDLQPFLKHCCDHICCLSHLPLTQQLPCARNHSGLWDGSKG